MEYLANGNSLYDSINFDLVGDELGKDVCFSLETALADGATFVNGSDPLTIFRNTVLSSVRDIEGHPRGKLLQDFLAIGPYELDGDIPEELAGKRLTDSETAAAIRFIYSFMINNFKGAITELLGAGACAKLLKRLRVDNVVPKNTLLYVGDVIMAPPSSGKGTRKAADMHFISFDPAASGIGNVSVDGVVEVKSYFQPEPRLFDQISLHLERAASGLRINGVNYSNESIVLGQGKRNQTKKVSVLPSDWKLSRSFRFEPSEHGRKLVMDRCQILVNEDEILALGNNSWLIRLRWSKEAIAEAAYVYVFKTFWTDFSFY